MIRHKLKLTLLPALAAFLIACAPPPPSPELAALLDKWEQKSLTVEEWDRILFLQFLERDDMDWVVKNFEANRDLLSVKPMASLYYATALCNLGGRTDAIEQKLLLVRKGIGEFDRIAQDFPQEIQVNLWRSITYSNFPDILGMDKQVVQDLNALEAYLDRGGHLEVDEQTLLVEAYLNLGNNYNSKEYLAAARRVLKAHPQAATPEIQKGLEELERKLGS